jgi:formamidase
MHDLVGGRYRLPWESEVVHVDGTSCGFAPPQRPYAGAQPAGPDGVPVVVPVARAA